MKVLQVIPDLKKGGAERITLDICNELTKQGAEVLLLNFREENDYDYLAEKIQRKVVPARFVPSLTKKPLSVLAEYEAAVRAFQPDVIHSHLYEAEMVTRQFILPGVKYVSHLHSNFRQLKKFSLQTLTKKSALINYAERKLLLRQYRKCANNFIAISNHTSEYYNHVLPDDLKRIQVLFNAIDYQRFSAKKKNATVKTPVQLVTTGSLVRRKNQSFLIETVHALHRQGYAVRLDILGDGPCRKELAKQAQDYGLENFIILHGITDKVEDYLHRADIYIHAATYEPFGLAPLEAMAAGLPCVMLDGKGNRDIAEEGKNCFLIERNDSAAFVDKLKKLIDTPTMYASMSEFAEKYASQFDIRPYTERLLNFYASCATA